MGVRSSSEFNREYEQLIDQFDVLQENVNEGLRYLEHKQTKQQYLLREISCHDKDAFLKREVLFQNRKSQLQNSRHVSPLVKIISNSQDQFCMTFFKIYALFQFPQRTLEDQINERGLQKRRFQQKQLWSILASCILGLSHLQKNNIKHSSLRSNTILISTDGIIKIYDPIATGCGTNYETVLSQRQTPHIYLSPQQVQGLKQQKITVENEPFKTDIWTMGMIVLQAGLLSYQDQCYRDQYSRIHWQTLQYNINQFQQTYSSELTNLVQFMLGKDERSRPDWFQLEEHVIKVEEDQRGNVMARRQEQSYHQQKKIQKGKEQRLFTMDKQLSESHTPSEINMPVTKIQPKVGITRSRQRPTYTSSSLILPQPIRASDISFTRPRRSIFPNNFYSNQSRVDQNLVLVPEEEFQTTDRQRFSIPSVSEHSQNSSSPIQNVPNIHFAAQPPPFYQYAFPSKPQPIQYMQPAINNSKAHFTSSPQTVQIQSSVRMSNDGEFVSEHYKQGSRYQGYKLNGVKHGYGKFFYQDGGRYEGDWRNGKMQGMGKLYYQSDRLAYDGEWHNDQFSGRGTLYNQFPQNLTVTYDYRNFDDVQQFWVKYQGDFYEDMKHGWGILYLSNSQYYQGQFKNDYADGSGTFLTKKGNAIRGRWHQNIMD